MEAHVHNLYQLEDPKREIAVQRLLRLRARAREPAADHRADDVHQPGEPALHNLQISRVRPKRHVGALVELRDRRVEHAHQERDRSVILEPTQVRERLELILQAFLVVQGVLLGLASRNRGDAVQPGGYERLRDSRHVRVQHARRLALEVRHARDQSRPQRQEVIDARGRPLPRLQRGEGKLSHRVDPGLVPRNRDELRQLVIGLQPGQEPAELVVVRVLAQALVPRENLRRSRDQALQVRVSFRLGREERPAHRRHSHQALQRDVADRRRAVPVHVEEQLHRGGFFDQRAPAGRHLDRADVLRRFVEARAHKVVREAG
mmetsp:Transcript_2916/g.12563  ORF Transcript_2916/g.12563 Transcript_2916/m.12563 type:complete len:319 (-) Transcript_2916:855-1811(-)